MKRGQLLSSMVSSILLSGCATTAESIDSTYLNQSISEVVTKYRVPAIAVATMASDQIALQEIVGVRVHNRPAEATLDDYFHIGSCSKSVLGLIAARLVEQRKIRWDTAFFDVFPELRSDASEAYAAITLEDLFLGEAGVRPFTSLHADPVPDLSGSINERRRLFIKHVLSLEPATKKKDGQFNQVYSNAGYVLASAMLEHRSGLNYDGMIEQFAQEQNMRIYTGWPNRLSQDQPWGHQIVKKKVVSFPPDHEYQFPTELSPAGNLSMSPRDYARYTQMHLRGSRGDKSYIESDGWRLLHFGHKGMSIGVVNSTLGGKRLVGFEGSAGTFFCRSLVFPDDDFALSILMNAGSGGFKMDAMDALTKRIVEQRFAWQGKFWKWWQ